MANLDDLLEKTSRTFALSIPLLPEPARREVSVAYLLFRIADTFEDAELWAPEERRKALGDFAGLLLPLPAGEGRGEGDPEGSLTRRFASASPAGRGETPAREPGRSEALAVAWTRHPPCRHDGYLELLRETPSVLQDFASLSEPARTIVCAHVRRSAEGMAGFVSRMTPAGDLVLDDLADLRRYCYAVAGIVGEMLTELFLLGRGFGEIEPFLRERAPLFGEGLQLVNILKDSFSDLREGRRYLPPGVERSEVFSLARNDLGRAGEYVLALQTSGAPRGLVGFTALPVELAWASLDRIEKFGAGAKVSRPEVFLISKRLERALDRNEPAIFSLSCNGRRI